MAAAYETSCRLDTSIFETIIRVSNNENYGMQLLSPGKYIVISFLKYSTGLFAYNRLIEYIGSC